MGGAEASVQYPVLEELQDEAATEGEEMKELVPEESEGEAEEEGNEEEEDDKEEEEEEGSEDSELMPSLEDSRETNIGEVGAEQLAPGLRRRIRPEWTQGRTLHCLEMQQIIQHIYGVNGFPPQRLFSYSSWSIQKKW